MVLINDAPPPLGDAIGQPLRKGYKPGEDPQEGMCSQPWADWFTNLMTNQSKSAGAIATVQVREQVAAIAATPITTTPLSAGLYQILFYLRLSEVDPVSASIVLTFNFTWNGAVRSIVSGTLGANTLAQTVGTPEPLIAVDANTQITYSTTVAWGVAGGKYAIDIVLNEVAA